MQVRQIVIVVFFIVGYIFCYVEQYIMLSSQDHITLSNDNNHQNIPSACQSLNDLAWGEWLKQDGNDLLRQEQCRHQLLERELARSAFHSIPNPIYVLESYLTRLVIQPFAVLLHSSLNAYMFAACYLGTYLPGVLLIIVVWIVLNFYTRIVFIRQQQQQQHILPCYSIPPPSHLCLPNNILLLGDGKEH